MLSILQRRLFLIISGLAIATTLSIVLGGWWWHQDQKSSSHSFLIDVSCDGNTFVFTGPETPNGNPDNGAAFVVQGVIYPAGTLADPNSGLLADGTPQFPSQVLGTWTCRGYFINEGLETPTGQFVVTTQTYDFGGEPFSGAPSLTSDGPELIDLGVPFARAVTGGTGFFRGVGGQVIQVAIGNNATGLFNFRFRFDL